MGPDQRIEKICLAARMAESRNCEKLPNPVQNLLARLGIQEVIGIWPVPFFLISFFLWSFSCFLFKIWILGTVAENVSKKWSWGPLLTYSWLVAE